MPEEEMTHEEKAKLAAESTDTPVNKPVTGAGIWGWFLLLLVIFIIIVCAKAWINDNNYSKSHYYSPEQQAQDKAYEDWLQEHEESTGGW